MKLLKRSSLLKLSTQSRAAMPPVSSRATPNLSLRQTQRLMAHLVMRPLTPAYRTPKTWIDGRKTADVVGEFIKPNDRLTALERLEIYNKQYWFRLIDCFYDDFPGLRAVLGDKKFDRLAKAYLAEHPSVSFSLRNLGQFLDEFMRQHPEMTKPRSDLAMDTAQIEWAQIIAFDGPANPPLTPEDLAGKRPANLKLALQPHLALLALRYAVDDFVIAVKKDARDDASNAVAEAPVHHKNRKRRLPKRQDVLLAVHRLDNIVYYKRLEPVEYRLLAALQNGSTVAKACAAALKGADPNHNWPAQIRAWFETWTSLGWLCKP